jgi:cytoskeletal protein CcmA (bactofilin family)
VSFKDDFVEALRSVKRDFFRDYDYSDQEKLAMGVAGDQEAVREQWPQPEAPAPQPVIINSAPESNNPQPPRHIPAQERDDVYNENYLAASRIEEEPVQDADDDGEVDAAPPYRSRQEHRAPVEQYRDRDRRSFVDYGDSGVYDDDKTVISKNTIIRGALQTEDSIRLLGQIMGDIDCKSNIVVAGKVRGNTNAANAYIFDAQVDGDVRCDDIITISSDAWVLGNIRAQQAEVDGKIKGNMEIRHMVSIGSSSSILGDISTDELEIKRGAFVNGQIMMYSPARDVLDRFDRFDE